MRYVVIIPAYNEESFLALMLDSLLAQSLLPVEVVVVDDNSTDATSQIAIGFANDYSLVKVVSTLSDSLHLPGSKVIKAFQKGLTALTADFDFIVKLDADLVLPHNYFETISHTFIADEKIGMAGGFATIEKDNEWIVEKLTDDDHIRGAFKAYRKKCFTDIGGLRPAMGWDTVDELLARYYGWKVVTIPGLHVKHLKPTGANYDKSSRYKQGESFYTLGYGLGITLIASAKLAVMKRKPSLFTDYIQGYFKAKSSRKPLLVTPLQAQFIRKYRLRKIINKIFARTNT